MASLNGALASGVDAANHVAESLRSLASQMQERFMSQGIVGTTG